ncbi:hypothetical protein EJ110_NYTH54188 [Nymphaea thermarum]|nr:putative folate-biopterin transporter 9 [Nymphaea thermarum]KAF3773957.1 hypothetical protein EJ110_NYTH54188 [Nymphaea thermarum]
METGRMSFCSRPNLRVCPSQSSFPNQRVTLMPSTRFSIFLAASNSRKNPKVSLPGRSNTKNSRNQSLKSFLSPNRTQKRPTRRKTDLPNGAKGWLLQAGEEYGIEMLVLSGVGYWVQGLRCLPWLALNFYFKDALQINPSTLQLVQNTANLPMVAKPLYGIVSDVLYIGDEHRVPYISIGVFLQVISWGTMALVPAAGEMLPALMACILLSNLGASITEVAGDALVAECSKRHRVGELQSYAWIALAAGGVVGNFSGGFILQKTQNPKFMFLVFCLLLCFQLGVSLSVSEKSLNLEMTKPYSSSSDFRLLAESVTGSVRRQLSELILVIRQPRILFPLSWAVLSTAIVPILSGSVFYFQTQILNVDSSVIGLSKVIGQMLVLSASVLYDRFLKKLPMRKLVCALQIIYAISILSDLLLVKQLNLRLGISNPLYISCFAALAEAVAQFKILPFSILLANRCPKGYEGSVLAFFMSMLCLSSIFSGYAGAAISYLLGMSSGNYARLPIGICLQFVAALVPLLWISYIPMSISTAAERRRMVIREGRSTR